MTVVQMPDGVNVDFGDMPPDQIRSLIQQKFPDAAAEARQPQVGSGNAFLRHMTNPFGISDEIGGVIEGVGDMVGLGPKDGSGTFSEGYDRFTSRARALDDVAFEQHPFMSLGGLLAGSVITGAPAINAITAPVKVAKTASMLEKAGNIAARTVAKVGNAALTGGAYGAEYGAASATGGPEERLHAGLLSGGVGLVAGGSLGLAGAAIEKPVSRLTEPMRAIFNPKLEAARKMTAAWTMDRGSPRAVADALKFSRQAGVPSMAVDMGEASRALGDSARNTSIEGRRILDEALNARQAGQLDRTLDIIRRAAPSVSSIKTREFLQQAAEAANKPAYDRAMLEGEKGIWNEGLEQLTVSDEMQKAIKGATKTGTNKAAVEGVRPPKNPFIEQSDGTLVLPPGVKPTLRFWDAVKRNLDGSIGRAKTAGDKSLTADLTAIKRQLVSYLDRAAPSYQKARAGAKAFFDAEDALSAGSNFVHMRADDFEGAAAALKDFSPAERQLFKDGFANTLVNELRERGDSRNIIDSIFLNSPAARHRIRLALGDGASNELEAHIRLERLFRMSRSIQGNSKTAQRLTELLLAGGAGVFAGGGDPFSVDSWKRAATDPFSLITAAIALGANRGRIKINQKVAAEVARLLASDDPKVVKEAIARLGKSPSLIHALRLGESQIARVVAPTVVPSGQALLSSMASGVQPTNADGQQ